MTDPVPPIPERNPPTGGRWLRDPDTGELVPLPPTDPEPSDEE